MIWSEFAGLQSRDNNRHGFRGFTRITRIMADSRSSVRIRGRSATLRLCPGDDHELPYCSSGTPSLLGPLTPIRDQPENKKIQPTEEEEKDQLVSSDEMSDDAHFKLRALIRRP